MNNYGKNILYYTKQDNDIYLKLKPHLNNAMANAKKLKGLDFENPHTTIPEMQILFNITEINSLTKQK